MPQDKYYRVTVGGQELDCSAKDIGLSLNYKLEDIDNFQSKKGSESFDITVPANPTNDRVGNTFHNPDVEDLTATEIFSSHQPGVIEANGHELLVGKAFLVKATHNAQPLDYTYDFYGNNADWIIDLKEATLYDCLKHITFDFTKANIEASWAFNGNDPLLPYVFAPVRYKDAMEKVGEITDYNMLPVYMKPSLSKYWILFWGFKIAGYRIDSTFFQTEYFRRQVMPWTWGNFLDSEGTATDIHRFLAIGPDVWFTLPEGGILHDFIDLKVTNDFASPAFDNNSTLPSGDYTYSTPLKEMQWTYNPPDYGTLEAAFSITLDYTVEVKANMTFFQFTVFWYVNGIEKQKDEGKNYGAEGTARFSEIITYFFKHEVTAGDVVTCKVFVYFERSKDLFRIDHWWNIRVRVSEFKLDYFRIPLNGTIIFSNLYSLKKYKFLDFLKGVLDEFNISPQTNSITKVVTLEPLHAYATGADQTDREPGYFNGDFIDWSAKQDLSKVSTMNLFSDFEREVIFAYKDDTSDGTLKVVQDREQHKLAVGKYVLPARFKEGKKEITNNFFSPVIHYDVSQWKAITGTMPQMIVMVPENISNTSREEAQNTFLPKSAYYKGNLSGVGGWIFDGDQKTTFPFMFAVNYQTGGEDDPVLSYSDERIGIAPGTRAFGLLSRFYLQRMAIMRHGRYYSTHFFLNNNDVTNWLHREHIICRGQKWELVELKQYMPMEEESTAVEMRKHYPVTEDDADSVFPAASNVTTGVMTADPFDLQYNQLKCLSTDIPTLP